MTTLREKMLEDMQIRRLAPATQRYYVRHVREFAEYFARRPDKLGPDHVREYEAHLLREGASYHTLRNFGCALRFLYKVTLRRPLMVEYIPLPKKARKLPTVLSPSEVARLLRSARNLKHRTLLSVACGGGLRVSEVVGLRVTDIDSDRMVITVRQGKGQKDRMVPLSPRMLDLLREYWRAYRPASWLFPGKPASRALTRRSAHRICVRAAELAGIDAAGAVSIR